ncbi:MAG: chorismate lyase [Oceanospirillaceae bacterium]|nr:chorismate lyase [Oceanospirillaceae bacterium]
MAAPAPWRSWLLDNGSLTQRLVSASRGRFHVEVLRQGFYRPSRSEALALGLPPRRLALIREVQLCGNGQPWVYARSVFPVSTLSGAERRLADIGNRPLGSVLFRDPSMQRDPLQIGELQLADGTRLWARRSVFHLSGKPLLVCEVFLPALESVEYPLRRNSFG